MKFWKLPNGEWISFSEFMKRWKKGMKEVVTKMPLASQVKQQMRFTKIMIFGMCCGIIVSLFDIKTLWWLTIILVGAVGNSLVQLIALTQQKINLEDAIEIENLMKRI